jgi:urease accessory protein
MDLLILQLADSAFPTGGFAHSAGLEAAYQHGEIRTTAEVRAFVRWTLAQAGRGALPLVLAAHGDVDRLPELDDLCDAFLTNPVVNRASRLQGRAWLAATARVLDRDALRRLVTVVGEHNLAPHHAPVFGAILSALDVTADRTARLFLFTTARTVLSAAVRLGIVGTHEAQQLQADVAEIIDRVNDRSAALTLDDLAQAAPLVDLWQAGHDRLYSRLFQS